MTGSSRRADGDATRSANGITARYFETDAERVVAFEREGDGGDEGDAAGPRAAIAQNRDGYAMLMVRTAPDGDEIERYYGLDVALDHAAELLGVDPGDLPVPEAASDMGM